MVENLIRDRFQDVPAGLGDSEAHFLQRVAQLGRQVRLVDYPVMPARRNKA